MHVQLSYSPLPHFILGGRGGGGPHLGGAIQGGGAVHCGVKHGPGRHPLERAAPAFVGSNSFASAIVLGPSCSFDIFAHLLSLPVVVNTNTPNVRSQQGFL